MWGITAYQAGKDQVPQSVFSLGVSDAKAYCNPVRKDGAELSSLVRLIVYTRLERMKLRSEQVRQQDPGPVNAGMGVEVGLVSVTYISLKKKKQL